MDTNIEKLSGNVVYPIIPFKCPYGEFSCEYVDTSNSTLAISCSECPKNPNNNNKI